MWIFVSIIIVIVSLKISSRYYKKMYPGMKLISTELVLIPIGTNPIGIKTSSVEITGC